MERLVNPLISNSFFLFGARGTGKSWYLNQKFPSAKFINLLEGNVYDRFSQNPALLSDVVAGLGSAEQWIVIDEVQRVPEILNMVHLEIEAHSRSAQGVTNERAKDRNLHFALTGSSARKLKRGKANLLAGRAFVNHLFPLTHLEVPEDYQLAEILEWGSLPRVCLAASSEERTEYLEAYVNTYLREEILEEQIARAAPPFRKFLEISAQSNGQIVNFSKIGRDVQLSSDTIKSYYQILEDTLLAYKIEPFHLSVRKRQRTAPKYYFFDLGVQRALSRSLGVALPPANYGFGRAFEHFIVCEIIRLSSYKRQNWEFSYLMTKDSVEIDLIIEKSFTDRILIEIKSTSQIQESDLSALKSLKRSIEHTQALVISQDKISRQVDGIQVLFWRDALAALGLV